MHSKPLGSGNNDWHFPELVDSGFLGNSKIIGAQLTFTLSIAP